MQNHLDTGSIASVGREWIDLDHGDRPDFTQMRIAFGIYEGHGGAR